MGKIFDEVGESLLRLWTKLEKKCPQCGADLDIVPELLSKRFPTIECEQCHLTIEVSTRNNYRMVYVTFFIPFVCFMVGFALGGIF